MAIGDIDTIITVGDMPSHGRGIPNLTLEGVRFFGRPNFAGERDQFKQEKRQFTVLIPADVADQVRSLGYNVKTTVPRNDEEEPLNHLKVAVDANEKRMPKMTIIQGSRQEALTLETIALIDRSRFDQIDIEIRGWEYDPEETPGAYSARLVEFVGVMPSSRLGEKYGTVG